MKKAIVLRWVEAALVAGACFPFFMITTSNEITAIVFVLFYAFLSAIPARENGKKRMPRPRMYSLAIGTIAGIALTAIGVKILASYILMPWLALYGALMLAGSWLFLYNAVKFVLACIDQRSEQTFTWVRLAESLCIALAVSIVYSNSAPVCSIKSVVLGIVVALLSYGATIKTSDRRINVASNVLATLFAMSCVLVRLVNAASVLSPVLQTIAAAVGFAGLFFLFRGTLQWLLGRMVSLRADTETPGRLDPLCFFCICALVMLLAWTPYYLCSYPANLSPDSFTQIRQALGELTASDTHAYIYTLCMRAVFTVAEKEGASLVTMIAWFTILQMIGIACGFSYLVTRLYALRVKRGICYAVLAYFALFPVHAEYSFTLWKDVPFALFIMLFSLTLWEMIARPQTTGAAQYAKAALLFVSCTSLLLFRSNAIYAAALAIPFFVWMFIKKSRLVSGACLLAIALAIIVKFPIYSAAGLASSDTIESLSIPAQQIARVIADEQPLTPEETEKLGVLADLDQVKDVYTPNISDPIKILVRNTGDQKALTDDAMGYARLWLSLGLKHPYQYLTAYIGQTHGFWHPDVQYWVCYNTWYNKSAFGMQPIVPQSVCDASNDWINIYHYIPLYGLMWSIGFAVWVAAILAAVCFVQRKTNALPAFLSVAVIWLVLLFTTPVYAEFRYLYSLFTTLPLLAVIPFMSQAEKTAVSKQ